MSSKRSNPTKWLIRGGLLLFYFLTLLTPLHAERPPPNKKVILQHRALNKASKRRITKTRAFPKRKILFAAPLSPNQPVLSISLSPNSWNVGETTTNKIITMQKKDKITITNNASLPETLEIKLIDPVGWKAAGNNGNEAYVLSGLLCGLEEVPEEAYFNQGGREDVITPLAKKATREVFAYNQAHYNGTAIPAGARRALYLQFKAPTLTQKKDEQSISVIISAQN